MKLNSLSDLLEEQLKDIYSAEQQLLLALPKMAEAVTSGELKEAFETHLTETESQVARLDTIAKKLSIKLNGKKCKGMEGLIEEAEESFEMEGEDELCDGAIIAAAQRIEHYEISAYGTACAIAETLGLDEAAELLQTTLDEELNADEKLTEISEAEVLQLDATDSDIAADDDDAVEDLDDDEDDDDEDLDEEGRV